MVQQALPAASLARGLVRLRQAADSAMSSLIVGEYMGSQPKVLRRCPPPCVLSKRITGQSHIDPQLHQALTGGAPPSFNRGPY